MGMSSLVFFIISCIAAIILDRVVRSAGGYRGRFPNGACGSDAIDPDTVFSIFERGNLGHDIDARFGGTISYWSYLREFRSKPAVERY